jgi:general secretion pathway protein A
MYEHFFRLKAEPFRLSPDHRFCYNHAQYAKAKAYMAYAFMRAEGFVMVTGSPGTGKTTLIGDLVESLADENVQVANLVSTQLAADDLLRMVAYAFGLAAEAAEKSSVLHQLSTRFLALHREGGRALLIVDEAQDLTHKAMEELRLLTNLQQDGKPLLQIFLLGQPELRDLIHGQGLEQVHQRIIATSNLRALREDETRAYVEHRLRVVGWQNDPAISTAVFPIIHLFSEGVPRRINLICSRLFLHCCVEQRHQITVADARTVVEELQEEQLSTRNLLNDELFLAQDVFDEPLPVAALVSATDARARSARGETHRETDVSVDAPPEEATSRPSLVSEKPAPQARPASPVKGTDTQLKKVRKYVEVQQYSTEKRELALRNGAGSGLNTDAWMTLLAALVAGAVVVLMVGMDGFM